MLTEADIKNLPDLDEEYFVEVGGASEKIKVKDFSVVYGMPNEQYHNSKDISASIIKAAKTPAHLLEYLVDKKDPSKAMNKGTAFHTMFLEPEKFEYVLFDDSKKVEEIGGDKPRSTTKYKLWKIDFEAKNAGKAILEKEAFKVMWSAMKRADQCPLIKAITKAGLMETSFFAELEDGLNIRVRPDCLAQINESYSSLLQFPHNIGDYINLSVKTTRDASPQGFRRDFFKLNYHLAEAFYTDVLESIYDTPVHTIVLAVEPDSGLFMLHYITPDSIEIGRFAYQKNLEVCKKFDFGKINAADILPGYEYLTGSYIVDL